MIIDKILNAYSLFEVANNLLNFLSAIKNSKDVRQQINNLKKAVHEIASQFALGQYFSYINKPFVMFDGRLSVIEYLARQWPDRQSFQFDCQILKNIATNIKSYIREPQGNTITEDAVRRLVTLANEQIDFSHRYKRVKAIYSKVSKYAPKMGQ